MKEYGWYIVCRILVIILLEKDRRYYILEKYLNLNSSHRRLFAYLKVK